TSLGYCSCHHTSDPEATVYLGGATTPFTNVAVSLSGQVAGNDGLSAFSTIYPSDIFSGNSVDFNDWTGFVGTLSIAGAKPSGGGSFSQVARGVIGSGHSLTFYDSYCFFDVGSCSWSCPTAPSFAGTMT